MTLWSLFFTPDLISAALCILRLLRDNILKISRIPFLFERFFQATPEVYEMFSQRSCSYILHFIFMLRPSFWQSSGFDLSLVWEAGVEKLFSIASRGAFYSFSLLSKSSVLYLACLFLVVPYQIQLLRVKWHFNILPTNLITHIQKFIRYILYQPSILRW